MEIQKSFNNKDNPAVLKIILAIGIALLLIGATLVYLKLERETNYTHTTGIIVGFLPDKYNRPCPLLISPESPDTVLIEVDGWYTFQQGEHIDFLLHKTDPTLSKFETPFIEKWLSSALILFMGFAFVIVPLIIMRRKNIV